jgi:lysophospholipase L1-like esterase
MLRTIKRTILCVLLAALTLFTIELGCRFLEPGPLQLRDQFPYIEDDQLGQAHRPSSDMSWRGSHFGINADGFRGPELKPNSTPKLYRVLCIGDSLTFGTGIEEHNSWPRQLEALLQEQLGEHVVEVINLGVSGWDSAHYRAAWRRFGPALVPDLVILGYSLNDLPGTSDALDALSFPEPPMAEGRFTRLKPAALLRHFHAEGVHRDRKERWEELHAEVSDALKPWRLNASASTRAELEPFIQEIRSSGATPMLLSFPYEFQLRSPAANRAPEGTLKMCCAGLEVPFLSMGPAFYSYILKESPGRAALYQRGTLCQPTKKGHEMIAESVIKILELEALLP